MPARPTNGRDSYPEGAMLFSITTALIAGYVLIAALGHVLLIQAMMASGDAR